MLRNYLKVTFRNLFFNKGYNAINIAGLTIAITCCVLIISYDLYELNYDRYNKNLNKIYRIEIDNWAASPLAVGPFVKETFPGVEQYVRFIHVNRAIAGEGNKIFSEKRFFFADSTVFKIFSLKIISGDKTNLLNTPNSLVITKSIAIKYFGSGNPVGKHLIITTSKRYDFNITGVIADLPGQSHFKFDFLASFNTLQLKDYNEKKDWQQSITYTYLLINKGTDLLPIEKVLKKTILARTGSPDTTSLNVYLRPLKMIHLYSNCEKEIEPQGNILNIFILSSIAVIILLLAAINFVNLSTARALNRTKEVAVRKTLGAGQEHIILQFIGESLLISLVSLILALAIVQILSKPFTSLSDTETSAYLTSPWLIFLSVGLSCLVAILAGVYPAFYISRFSVVKIFKSGFKVESRSSFSLLLRKGLIVFQFIISVILLIGLQIISKQMNFIQNKNLGMAAEQVLIAPINNITSESYYALKTELLRNSEISYVTASLNIPSKRIIIDELQPYNKIDEPQDLRILIAGFDFPETYGIKLDYGRSFSRKFPADSSGAFILNNEAASLFGWKKPVGNKLSFLSLNRDGNIVGIVKDFNFASLYSKIEPLAIFLTTNPKYFKYISIRLGAGKKINQVNTVAEIWKKVLPGVPFEYSFLNQNFNSLYKSDMRLHIITEIFTFLGIFIACLGLMGLVSINVKQRIKEIGIRKVLGASTLNIIILFSKEFLLLVVVSNIIAWPAAYYIMNNWLKDFAYRININLWIFILSGIIALIIALLTVSSHATKAAVEDPVKSLKYE